MPAFTFGIAYDYLCPFARNANEHVVTGLRGGADWDVEFVPFSLSQNKVEHGGVDVWDRDDPWSVSGVLALAAGLVVRDHHPDRFLDVHEALFAARHDHGRDINDRDVVAEVLTSCHLDAEDVLAHLGIGLQALGKEHLWAADNHSVWGVPTFIAGDRAVFVRLLSRPNGNTGRARFEVERIVDLVANVSAIHEFKQTDLRV